MKIKYRDVFTTSFGVEDEVAFEKEPLIKKLINHCLQLNIVYRTKDGKYVFAIKAEFLKQFKDIDRKLRDVILKHLRKEDICLLRGTATHKGEVHSFRFGIVGSRK